MIKKILKIVGIFIVVLIIALISLPFIFSGTIKDKIRYLANEHVNAKVDFADVDISLIRSFPKASVIIDELSIINYAPFEGDTLAYAKKIALDMSINELFKDASEAIGVQRVVIDEATINVKTDSLSNVNYDIAKAETTTPETSTEESSSFAFELEHYEINNSKLLYQDDVSKIALLMTNINHSGDGTLSGEKILLDTESSSEISFLMDGTNYLNKHKLRLDANLELDMENQRYAFKENKAFINQLPLEFAGFVQLDEKYTDIDISFKTPTSDFKNFLAVVPAEYAKNLDGVQTSGDFSIDGVVKGKVDDTHIPMMDIKIASNNASFKYPDLPKGVQNIVIDTQIKNDTGLMDDIYVLLNTLTFKIDQDTFAAKGSLKHVTQNMLVDMAINGTLNLANLEKAYPLELEEQLNGILKANIKTNFDMQSLEKEQYQNVKSSGNVSIDNFTYASPELPNEIKIENANVSFKPETITLDKMKVTTGTSDLTAEGAINNLMGFLFTKQNLKGNFTVASQVFAVSDFMVAGNETAEEQTTEKTPSEALQIPSFLDANLNFSANKVLYDNLELQNTKGSVVIKDETASLKNVTSNLLGGGIAFDGNVSTKSAIPTFNMNMDLSKIDIVKSFASLELLKGLAPIAQALTGALSTKMTLAGNLTNDLTPVLTSLKGNALANILNAKVSTAQTPLLAKLDNQINFIDLNNLDLKDIQTALTFDDGKINVKPFDIDIKGIKITASGSHGFDMNMDYNLAMDVPAKYLGKDVGGILSQLNEKEVSEMTVALPVGITGNFSNPKVSLNTGDAVKALTQQIVSKQKDKVKDKITDEGTKVLSGLLGGNSKDEDTTKTTTEKPEEKLKDAAKNILGGFLNKNKKKDTTDN
ncbi:AsmA-like C-terminal region-containing protein [Aquimarina addita]|uniref:AsmA-like C-terminal region-containing protein n=1 Tax=Aquimarina addita TaxID=870485 RepID=A0ABP6UUE2_9FLAO